MGSKIRTSPWVARQPIVGPARSVLTDDRIIGPSQCRIDVIAAVVVRVVDHGRERGQVAVTAFGVGMGIVFGQSGAHGLKASYIITHGKACRLGGLGC